MTPTERPFPEYSASGRPSSTGERLAMQMWILLFLLTITFALVNYLLIVWK